MDGAVPPPSRSSGHQGTLESGREWTGAPLAIEITTEFMLQKILTYEIIVT
jgi:hypothetical protein